MFRYNLKASLISDLNENGVTISDEERASKTFVNSLIQYLIKLSFLIATENKLFEE